MTLAAMTAADEDALVCDFAETYHVYNYRGLPLRYAATLACGLRDNSRIKLKMSGQKLPAEVFLQAGMLDALNLLVWFKTEDARKRRNRPTSILALLRDGPEKPALRGFDTPDDFTKRWEELRGC